MKKLNILVLINERSFFYDVRLDWFYFSFKSKIGCMFWHVIQLFPIVHDEHIERIAILNNAMENVEFLTRLQYMDDEAELFSSLALVVGFYNLLKWVAFILYQIWMEFLWLQASKRFKV